MSQTVSLPGRASYEEINPMMYHPHWGFDELGGCKMTPKIGWLQRCLIFRLTTNAGLINLMKYPTIDYISLNSSISCLMISNSIEFYLILYKYPIIYIYIILYYIYVYMYIYRMISHEIQPYLTFWLVQQHLILLLGSRYPRQDAWCFRAFEEVAGLRISAEWYLKILGKADAIHDFPHFPIHFPHFLH